MVAAKEQVKRFRGATQKIAEAYVNRWIGDLSSHKALDVISVVVTRKHTKWVSTVTHAETK